MIQNPITCLGCENKGIQEECEWIGRELIRFS